VERRKKELFRTATAPPVTEEVFEHSLEVDAAIAPAATPAAAAAATPDAIPAATAADAEAVACGATVLPYEPKPLPLLQVCSERKDAPDQAFAYLWRHRSSAELAHDIEQALLDFDTLARECDLLFREACLAEAVAADRAEVSLDRISAEQLHHVTQRLIDFLGSRSPAILERIGHIYGVAASGGGECIGAVEFRGYVAAVLTQILRELEDRPPEIEAVVAGPGEEAHQSEPQEEASAIGALADPSALLEAMQSWFTSAAEAIGFGEAAVALASAEEQQQEKEAPTAEGHMPGSEAPTAEGHMLGSEAQTAEGQTLRSEAPTAEGYTPESEAPTAEGHTPGSETSIVDGQTQGAEAKPVLCESQTAEGQTQGAEAMRAADGAASER